MTDESRNTTDAEARLNPLKPEGSDLGGRTLFSRLDDANGRPNTVMVMAADCGADPLLACPIADIRASHDVLYQLLSDLENFSCGRIRLDPHAPPRVADAEVHFYKVNDPQQPIAHPTSPERRGLHQLWISEQLEALDLDFKAQIEAILAGRQDRLRIPPEYPHEELDDPRAIPLHFSLASVKIVSGSRAEMILNWPACAVKITREPLQLLADILESRIRLESPRKPIEIPSGATYPPPTVSIRRDGALFTGPKFNNRLLPQVRVQRVMLALQGELPVERVIAGRIWTSEGLVKLA